MPERPYPGRLTLVIAQFTLSTPRSDSDSADFAQRQPPLKSRDYRHGDDDDDAFVILADINSLHRS